jgi:hypothetical protein
MLITAKEGRMSQIEITLNLIHTDVLQALSTMHEEQNRLNETVTEMKKVVEPISKSPEEDNKAG